MYGDMPIGGRIPMVTGFYRNTWLIRMHVHIWSTSQGFLVWNKSFKPILWFCFFSQQYTASCERPGMKRCVFWSIRKWSFTRFDWYLYLQSYWSKTIFGSLVGETEKNWWLEKGNSRRHDCHERRGGTVLSVFALNTGSPQSPKRLAKVLPVSKLSSLCPTIVR